MKRKVYVFLFVVLIYMCSNIDLSYGSEFTNIVHLTDTEQERIDSLVNQITKKSNVPGVSISIVYGDQTTYLSYGYADQQSKSAVVQDTLFELGSMSKAFTGLGILLLADEGKLSLNDLVTTYIPWFHVSYNGMHDGKRYNGSPDLTIANLLYHTSGIPFDSIGRIPEGVSDDMLEKTVRTLIGIELDYYPGERYQYATINYDVLGYIIQVVTGETFESFIQNNILKPLGLNHTYLFQHEAQETGFLATGYKNTFFSAKPYDAPRYRGNTPAGYFFSNALDMERWMRIQLGLVDVPEQLKRIIAHSHEGDTTVASQKGNYYGAGWMSGIKGDYIEHPGSNPNFSSKLIARLDENISICVLANLNSNAASYLANNILNIIQGKEIERYTTDTYKSMDAFFSVAIILSIIVSAGYLLFLIKSILELCKRKRNRCKAKGAFGLLIAIPLIVFVGFCLYYLPNILFQRLQWSAVNVWGSWTTMAGCIAGFVTFTIFFGYVLFALSFPKDKEKGYLALIPLGLINSAANALIIFTINESFNRDLYYSTELLIYFIFSLLLYIYTYKLLHGRLMIIANEVTYEKRIVMIERILQSSYQSIENLGRDRIFSGLNNDCASLSQLPDIVVRFFTSLLTFIFCLYYLLTKNVWAFAVTVCILLFNGILAITTSKVASQFWEKNRDVENVYFNQMQDLVNGFKELVLNRFRRHAFGKDMKKYSRLSAEFNKSASIKFLNLRLCTIFSQNMVFGVVIFLLPILMLSLDVDQLREIVMIVFYMVSPFAVLAGVIPQFTKINVNIKRINQLIAELIESSTDETELEMIAEQAVVISNNDKIRIEFNNVVYRYSDKEKVSGANKDESEFTLGPISAKFESGEIIFITGGNGSGKSTFGKLITGLYTPQEGSIVLNGEETTQKGLNELFASVYTDFNLFKKMYGIDYESKKEETKRYFQTMMIDNIVKVSDEGDMNPNSLSTGQRKRLAFVISCLEDKHMIILDEWAAEQDPGFRAYFYDELLPMLKRQGKGIIVITHDDRYFDRADKIIKLERGMMV